MEEKVITQLGFDGCKEGDEFDDVCANQWHKGRQGRARCYLGFSFINKTFAGYN